MLFRSIGKEQSCKNYIQREPGKRSYFVAETAGGRVVGGCGVDIFEGLDDCAELQKLYVADDFHGHGIATKLVRKGIL